ncbi:MAG: hypothetical protein DRN33_06375 [Thermoplasmata archaeon]|nr:MAG: hypothetical protein DRN33_06375 [Thermoplasmata archaeon]
MRRTYVRPHFAKRGRTKYKVSGHYRKTVGSLAQGRSGKRFKSLESKIKREYIKKGYSKARAEKIAKATAGKIFWQKFGKRKGSRILRRER